MLDQRAVRLDDRVAVVTGGGGGIGRSISETLAQFGATVVVGERDEGRAADTAAAIVGRGGEATVCVVDVRVAEDVERLKEHTLERHGQIDVLVNNVGDFLGARHPFVDGTEHEWDELYRVNLHHMFLCARAFAPLMIERGIGGSIINVSSIEAFRAVPDSAVYGTFKHAVTGFTRNLAVELGQHGIRVNAIAPETTETLQVPTSRTFGDRAHLIPYWVPLGRFGQPSDTAGCALFLACDLSAWTTGSTVHVDGGVLAASGFFRSPVGNQWTNCPQFDLSGASPTEAAIRRCP